MSRPIWRWRLNRSHGKRRMALQTDRPKRITMDTPNCLICERCGSDSPVVMVKGIDNCGDPARWPKSIMRNGLLNVFIHCPRCGEREQHLAEPAMPGV
jgi:ribosomal protein L37E